MSKKIEELSDGYLNRTPIFQFILLSLIFPLWAAAASLNDVLITQFKSVFSLSDFATALVQSAFYGGYFIIAIPASMIIKKSSYKFAILVGLAFFIVGCLMFYPASMMATYFMFLVAIFVIAIGLSFLETSCGTFSTMIGPKKHSILRLNISQTFYPIGAILGTLLGKYLIFQTGSNGQMQFGLTPEQVHFFKLESLKHTLEPYKFLILILICIFVLFVFTKYPKCKPKEECVDNNVAKTGILETLIYLFSNLRFCRGIIAQFLYVGMQVSIWSFTMRLALNIDKNLHERYAANFMIFSFIIFFVGRFLASSLMTKFQPKKILFIYAALGSLCLLYIVLVPNTSVIYATILVSLFMGPCWPTIYAENLSLIESKYVEAGGAIVVMAIVGGAVIPAIQGYVSDVIGSMRISFFVPLICFLYVAYYFYGEIKKRSN